MILLIYLIINSNDQYSVDFSGQVNTEVIAGEGMIVTAGAIDCHVHFICPQLAYEAITSGEIFNNKVSHMLVLFYLIFWVHMATAQAKHWMIA